MHVKYKRYYYNRKSVLFRILCVMIIILILFLLIDAKLRPAIYDLAVLEAHAVSSETVNSAVDALLSENMPAYSDLVSINYGENNAITGITTNIVKINLLKSRVSNAIDSAFKAKKKTTVRVPVGSASGIAFLSGFGPYINVDIGFSSSTQTDFTNIFESAGINQTQHSVMLEVKTTVMLVLSGKRITKTVNTAFCVAQTVIVGSVPNIYAQ